MQWSVVVDGPDTPQNHMDKDKDLLDRISSFEGPMLRFYEWGAPSLTYGYFIKPEDHLNLKAVDQYGLKIGRRPTGGGIIFHLKDLAFSVLIPATDDHYSTNTLQNYAYVNGLVRDAILKVNNQLNLTLLTADTNNGVNASKYFCMAKPTIYDIMVGGKKIGGAAQRRTKEGFLHQGSVSVSLLDDNLLKDVLKNSSLIDEIKNHTYCFTENSHEAACIKNILKEYLILEFTKEF